MSEGALFGDEFVQRGDQGIHVRHSGGDGEIEGLEAAIWFFKVLCREGVVLPFFCRWTVMQDHVHGSQSSGGAILFLPEDRYSSQCLVGGFQQQRAGPTGGGLNDLVLASFAIDTNNLGQKARDLNR